MNSLPSHTPSRQRGRRSAALAGILSLAALALTACGSADPEVEDSSQHGSAEQSEHGSRGETSTGPNGPDEARPDTATQGGAAEFDASALPSCEVIERQVGGGLETLEFAGEELHIAEHAMDSTSLSCVWLTEMYQDLEGADLNTLMEAVHTGALTLSINVSPQPLAAEDADMTGFLFPDLRAERVGGFVFAPKDTDLSDPLGMMGITVMVDRVDVTWGGGTYFDGQGDQIAEMFNKDWGIDAAVTVHRLIWD